VDNRILKGKVMRRTILALALLVSVSLAPFGTVRAQNASAAAPHNLFTVSLDAGLLNIPGGTAQLGHNIDQPGWTLTQTFPYATVIFVSVVSGQFTVTSAGPASILRMGLFPEAVAPGVKATANAGDTAVFLSNYQSVQANEGTTPTERFWMIVGAGQPTTSVSNDKTAGDGPWTLDPAQWRPATSGTMTVTLATGSDDMPAPAANTLIGTLGGSWVEASFAAGTTSGVKTVSFATAATPAALGTPAS
jgi:hypothetical protein